MPPKSKSKARVFSKTTTKPTAPPSIGPPEPYKPAPKKLEPFLKLLSDNHVYITHIDTKPRDHKAKIFAVPVAMNVVIIGLLLWRISVVGPFYMKICFSMMGKYNETTINPNVLPLNEISKEILRRAGSKWDREIKNPLEEENGKNLILQTVGKAVDQAWMHDRTGYLMLNREWDLDWKVIVKATKLVDRGTLSINDFKTTILVHSKEFGWMIIETPEASGSVKEEESRAKIVAFKDELTAMGKENLFFRWIELVQFELSGPNGSGPEQQLQTMRKAKKMFEDQGVDFEKFWDKVGGPGGMPGMEDI
ncbi:hypothetical protein B7463_g897, partial [Scytalidium lignicola]